MGTMIHVSRADDPRIVAYQNVRDKDLLRDETFVAEGEVVLRVLCSSRPSWVESLLLSESRAVALADLLDSLPPEVPVYVAAQEVMDAVVGFEIHRGILAIGRRPPHVSLEERVRSLGPGPVLVVAAIGIANHDNVGGIFRNAAAFGVDALLLDSVSCDPLYRKAIRVSVGGVLRVPFSRAGEAGEILGALEQAAITPIALSPRGTHDLGSFRFPERSALLLGAEGPGLSDAVLGRSTTVRIAMSGGFDSLNVATTSGIALHAARSRLAQG